MNFKKEDTKNNKSTIILIFLIGISVIILTVAQSNNVVNLSSDIKNYFIEASKGNIAGTESINKFGENLGIGTVLEDVQSQGGELIFLESAEKINITSSSASDTISGVGARKVIIIGLDENFTEINEEINLSGATISQTTNSYIRIYRMYVTEIGNYGGVNIGIITGTADVNGSTQIEIPLGEGQSETTHYTVPAGKKAIIKQISITMDTGKVIDVSLITRPKANNTVSNMFSQRHVEHWRGIDAPVQIESFSNKLIDEKTDIWFMAKVSTGSAEVEINYDLILYDI